jgi:hypothetical protein
MDFLGAINWADEDAIVVDDNGVRLGVVRANGNGTYRAHQAMTDPDVIAQQRRRASNPETNGLREYGPKMITVAGKRSELQQVKSLAHEIGHALLQGNPQAGLSRSTVKLEAESVAYVVCQRLGLDTSGCSFGYCAAWKGGEAAKVREADSRRAGGRGHPAA